MSVNVRSSKSKIAINTNTTRNNIDKLIGEAEIHNRNIQDLRENVFQQPTKPTNNRNELNNRKIEHDQIDKIKGLVSYFKISETNVANPLNDQRLFGYYRGDLDNVGVIPLDEWIRRMITPNQNFTVDIYKSNNGEYYKRKQQQQSQYHSSSQTPQQLSESDYKTLLTMSESSTSQYFDYNMKSSKQFANNDELRIFIENQLNIIKNYYETTNINKIIQPQQQQQQQQQYSYQTIQSKSALINYVYAVKSLSNILLKYFEYSYNFYVRDLKNKSLKNKSLKENLERFNKEFREKYNDKFDLSSISAFLKSIEKMGELFKEDYPLSNEESAKKMFEDLQKANRDIYLGGIEKNRYSVDVNDKIREKLLTYEIELDEKIEKLVKKKDEFANSLTDIELLYVECYAIKLVNTYIDLLLKIPELLKTGKLNKKTIDGHSAKLYSRFYSKKLFKFDQRAIFFAEKDDRKHMLRRELIKKFEEYLEIAKTKPHEYVDFVVSVQRKLKDYVGKTKSELYANIPNNKIKRQISIGRITNKELDKYIENLNNKNTQLKIRKQLVQNKIFEKQYAVISDVLKNHLGYITKVQDIQKSPYGDKFYEAIKTELSLKETVKYENLMKKYYANYSHYGLDEAYPVPYIAILIQDPKKKILYGIVFVDFFWLVLQSDTRRTIKDVIADFCSSNKERCKVKENEVPPIFTLRTTDEKSNVKKYLSGDYPKKGTEYRRKILSKDVRIKPVVLLDGQYTCYDDSMTVEQIIMRIGKRQCKSIKFPMYELIEQVTGLDKKDPKAKQLINTGFPNGFSMQSFQSVFS